MAFASAKSSFTALLSYITIVYAYAADHVYFNEELEVEQVVATLVILFTAFIVTY